MRIYRITSPVSNPAINSYTVSLGDVHNGSPYTRQPAPQKNEFASGTVQNLDAGDSRMQNAVLQFFPNSPTTTTDDKWFLYATHMVIPPSGDNQGESTVRWYKIDQVAGTLSETGEVGGEEWSPDAHTYYPSIAVDDPGNLGMSLCASSATKFASACYTGRKVSDPVGTMQALGVRAEGRGSYVVVSNGFNRWGDYSAICVDPDDGSTFWTYNNYAGLNAPADVNAEYNVTDSYWQTAYGSFSVRDNTRQNDLNGDGFPDLIFQYSLSGSTATGRINTYFMDRLNRIYSSVTNPNTSGSTFLLRAIADINGDNKSDFVFKTTSNKFRFWTMNGSARVAKITPSPDVVFTSSICCAADFNADNSIDVLTRSSTSYCHYVFRFGQTTVSGVTGSIPHLGSSEILVANGVTYPSATWAARASADMNGDGQRDLIVQNTSTGACYIWESTWDITTGKLKCNTHTAIDSSSQISGASNIIRGVDDMDGDGKLDLIIQNGTSIRIKTRLAGAGYVFGAYVSFNPATISSSNWTIRNN